MDALQIYSLPITDYFLVFESRFQGRKVCTIFVVLIILSHVSFDLPIPDSSRKKKTIELKEPSLSTASCSDSTSHVEYVLLDNSLCEDFSIE